MHKTDLMFLPRNRSYSSIQWRLVGAALLVAGLFLPAQANTLSDVERDLGRLNQQLQRAEDSFTEQRSAHQLATEALESLKLKLIDVTSRVQELEMKALVVDDDLRQTRQKRDQVQDRFLSKRDELSQILSAMQRLGAEPAASVLLAPGGAEDAARAGILLDGLMSGLRGKATVLRGELEQLTALEEATLTLQGELDSLLEQLAREQAELDPLVAERQRLVQKWSANLNQSQAQVGLLSAKTSGLRDLLDQLQRYEQQALLSAPVVLIPVPRLNPRRGKEKTPQTWVEIPKENLVQPVLQTSRRFQGQKGALKLPVSGRTLFAYGDKRANGETVHGITLDVRRGARVQAPVDGKIVFAGPFRSYGHLLIIAPAKGYHLLLAGLGSIDVHVGQWLLRGEPVGRMTEGGQQNGVFTPSKTSLYIELRKNGEPINPAPWFKLVPGKVTGL